MKETDRSCFRLRELALCIESDGSAVRRVFRVDGALPEERPDAVTEQAKRELEAYFSGKLTAFSVPIRPDGTAFQKRVWQALRMIPFGETRSYSEIAKAAGHPGAARAAGQAIGANPILILIPCHRVIRGDGGLGGFSAGIDMKRWLLKLEKRD